MKMKNLFLYPLKLEQFGIQSEYASVDRRLWCSRNDNYPPYVLSGEGRIFDIASFPAVRDWCIVSRPRDPAAGCENRGIILQAIMEKYIEE